QSGLPRKAAVNELEPGTRKKSLVRDMAVDRPRFLPQPGFSFVTGRKAGVAAFAGESYPLAIAGRYQAGDAQPGSWPEQADRGIAHRFAATNQFKFVGRQVR